jgi:hypothetical protein
VQTKRREASWGIPILPQLKSQDQNNNDMSPSHKHRAKQTVKINIKYNSAFSIPTVLPHAPFEGDEQSDICCDEVTVKPCFSEPFKAGRAVVAEVIVSSRCGTTTMNCVARMVDGGIQVCGRGGDAEGPEAVFEGAERALNSVWGIEFPPYEVQGDIESSYGRFKTLDGYRDAKAAVKAIQSAGR